MPKREDPIIRFWRKVDKTEGCWLWTGSANPRYGAFGPRKGKCVHAHRYSWELAYGPIPPGMCILHHCDTPLCVRPDHLFQGTQRDNMHDMAAKGRQWVPPPKFDNARKQELAARYYAGNITQRQLAAQYGTSPQYVNAIIVADRAARKAARIAREEGTVAA